MFSWFSVLGIDHSVAFIRQWAASIYFVVPAWVCLSLPQALWVFSGCLAVHSIWGSYHSWHEQFWMIIVFSMALGGELGQGIGFVPGTFDAQDLGLVIIAFLIAQVIAFFTSSKNEFGGNL